VHGAVTYEGKPLLTGTVMFQPQSGKAVIGQLRDGAYELRAAAGLYRVGIVSLAEIPTDVDVWKQDAKLPSPPLPEKYHRPESSRITAEVTPGDSNALPLRTT
jgi:hypothetical protein